MPNNTFPFLPPKSTEQRLSSFDEYVYKADSSSILYKLVDALCGTTGVGSLVNQNFLGRMSVAMETIYFSDLDYIFGKISFLARTSAESYPYDPMMDQLTADQWNEIRVKDSWYRARVKDFFKACSLGGTPEGIAMAVQAAVATECDIDEVWRAVDHFGLSAGLGRAPHTARNEVVVRPYKDSLTPPEIRLLRDMLDRVCPVDTIITVNTEGLAVISPVTVAAAAADSSYFEVQRKVLATPVLDKLPPPELLPIDLMSSEVWLYEAKTDPTIAPYAAFNITQEFGLYYLIGGGRRSPIDSVTYGVLQEDGSVKSEHNYQMFNTTGGFSSVIHYDKADSPENYPGGKYGLHPSTAPALNPDQSHYHFPYASQAEYVTHKKAEIISLGGKADDQGYQLPLSKIASSARVFYPEYAIAYFPPTKDSTISEAVMQPRGEGRRAPELRDPVNFIHNK